MRRQAYFIDYSTEFDVFKVKIHSLISEYVELIDGLRNVIAVGNHCIRVNGAIVNTSNANGHD